MTAQFVVGDPPLASRPSEEEPTTIAVPTLRDLEPSCSLDEALTLFDALPTARAEEVLGTWRGRELRTGHPYDGLLDAAGWWGKRFDAVDDVHPLLFTTRAGVVRPLDPRRVPLGLAGTVPAATVARLRPLADAAHPLLGTSLHRARLRHVEHRGVVTVAMVYDHLPIIDVFRRVDEDTLLGVMDERGNPPYVFVLARPS